MHKLLGLAYLIFLLQSQADTIRGRVVKVAGGDTMTVLEGTTQHKVRLMDIAPPRRIKPLATDPYRTWQTCGWKNC